MANELDLKMTRICDAVRDKTGVAGKLNLDTIAENIETFETGGGENLDAVLAEQASLIAELEAALEGKASGGGSVKTCTLVVNGDSDAKVYDYVYSYVDNTGKVTIEIVHSGTGLTNFNVTLNNVVCDSLFYIFWSGLSESVDVAGGIEIVRDNDGLTSLSYFKMPTESGVTATLTLIGDD